MAAPAVGGRRKFESREVRAIRHLGFIVSLCRRWIVET
jgi:hypothetical protein